MVGVELQGLTSTEDRSSESHVEVVGDASEVLRRGEARSRSTRGGEEGGSEQRRGCLRWRTRRTTW